MSDLVPPGDSPEADPQVAVPAPEPVYMDPAADFRARLHALTPRVFVTFVLLGINIAVFIAMLLNGVAIENPKIDSLIRWGADFGPATITGGQWWRLLTSMFIHIGIVHLAFNMFVLFQIGPFVERLLGNTGFLLVYMLSGLAGGFASLAWNPHVVGAGASGAIFGLYGALLGFLAISRKDSIPAEVLAPLRQSALVFIGYNAVFGFIRAGTDVAAHAGGLAGGFVCGLALCLPLTLDQKRQRVVRNALMAAGAAVVMIGLAAQLPRPVDLAAAVQKFSAVESKSLASYNALIKRAKDEKLSDDKMADALEKDVLPAWIQARNELSNLKGIKSLPPRQQQIVYGIVQYAQVREEAWTLFAQALRRHDSSLVEQANAKQRNADLLATQLTAQPK